MSTCAFLIIPYLFITCIGACTHDDTHCRFGMSISISHEGAHSIIDELNMKNGA